MIDPAKPRNDAVGDAERTCSPALLEMIGITKELLSNLVYDGLFMRRFCCPR